MRYFVILILFLVLTVSSFAKNSVRLRLRGSVPFAASVAVQKKSWDQRDYYAFRLFDNAAHGEGIKIQVAHNGVITKKKIFANDSRFFSTIIPKNKRAAKQSLTLTLSAI